MYFNLYLNIDIQSQPYTYRVSINSSALPLYCPNTVHVTLQMVTDGLAHVVVCTAPQTLKRVEYIRLLPHVSWHRVHWLCSRSAQICTRSFSDEKVVQGTTRSSDNSGVLWVQLYAIFQTSPPAICNLK